MKTLGDHIRHYREALGLSQGDLAKASGVSQATISELEANKQSASRKIVEIAGALNIPVEDLAPGRRMSTRLKREAEPPTGIAPTQSDNCDIEDAIAVAEGALLSAGLDPAHLGELRQLLRECLAEPVISSTPQSALESRRNITRSVVSRFLKQHGHQDGVK